MAKELQKMCGSSYRPRRAPSDYMQNENSNIPAQNAQPPNQQILQQQNQQFLKRPFTKDQAYPTNWNNNAHSWGHNEFQPTPAYSSSWAQHQSMYNPTPTSPEWMNPPNRPVQYYRSTNPYQWQPYNQAHHPQFNPTPPIKSPPLLHANQTPQRSYPNGI